MPNVRRSSKSSTLLLKPSEVAARFAISSRQVLRLPIARVRLSPRVIRFKQEDVDEYLAENETQY